MQSSTERYKKYLHAAKPFPIDKILKNVYNILESKETKKF